MWQLFCLASFIHLCMARHKIHERVATYSWKALRRTLHLLAFPEVTATRILFHALKAITDYQGKWYVCFPKTACGRWSVLFTYPVSTCMPNQVKWCHKEQMTDAPRSLISVYLLFLQWGSATCTHTATSPSGLLKHVHTAGFNTDISRN